MESEATKYSPTQLSVMAFIERVISHHEKKLDLEKKEQAIEALTGTPGMLINQTRLRAKLIILADQIPKEVMANKTERFIAFSIIPKDVKSFITKIFSSP